MSNWIALVACSNPPPVVETIEDPTTPEGDVVVELTATISAAEGGELMLGDGAALIVPPGALSSDAEVRFSRETCRRAWSAASFGSCRYLVDTGSVGWVGRFTVTLPTRSGGPAWAVRDARDGLRPLVDSAALSGTVRATGSEDGAFTSRMAALSPIDDRCTDAPFEPCGGDIDGRWELTDACGSTAQIAGISWGGSDPYEACKPLDYVVDYPFAASGSVTFMADGTFESSSHATVLEHQTVTLGCLEEIGEECLSSCTNDGITCSCVWPKTEGSSGSELDWVLVADGVEIGGVVYRYCVDGDTLALEHPHSDGPYLMYYQRSP